MGSCATTKLLSRRSGNGLFHKIYLTLGYVVSEHCSENPAPCRGCLAKGALLSERQRFTAGLRKKRERCEMKHASLTHELNTKEGFAHLLPGKPGFLPAELVWDAVSGVCPGRDHAPPLIGMRNTTANLCMLCLSLLSLTFSALGEILAGCFLLLS